MSSDNRYARLGRNTFLVFIGNIGSKLISLLMLPFYTRWLSVVDYGTVDLISVYVSFLTGIVTCCMTEAIFRFPKDQPVVVQKSYFSSGLFFSFLSFSLFGVFFYFSDFFFQKLDVENVFSEYSLCIYIIILINFTQSYVQQFARSIDKMQVYVIAGILQTIFTAFFSFIFIPNWGVIGFVWAQILSTFICTLYLVLFIKAYRYISIKLISTLRIKSMLFYSMPLIPNSIMGWVINALNRPMIESSLGLDAVGLFAVANKFPTLISSLLVLFSYSWQISVIEEFNKSDYKEFYNRVLKMVLLFLFFLSTLLAFSSYWLIELMAAPAFIDSWRLVPILSLSVVFFSLSIFVGANFSATKQTMHYFTTSIWGGAASILLCYLLIPFWGLFGAAVALVISHLVMLLFRLIYSWKYAPLIGIGKYLSILLFNIVIVVFVTFIDNLYLKLFVLLLFYVIVFYTNKVIMREISLLIYSYLKKHKCL